MRHRRILSASRNLPCGEVGDFLVEMARLHFMGAVCVADRVLFRRRRGMLSVDDVREATCAQ